MNIQGETIVWENKKGYSISVGERFVNPETDEEEWDNHFIPVSFKKGVKVNHGDRIDVKDGFITFFRTREGEGVTKLVILDFEPIEDEDEKDTKKSKSKSSKRRR